ncbi:class I SAM-dependent methyltransferase [Thalassiella azotivora]
MPVQRPVGSVTRGTTNANRLRRVDRWLAGPAAGALRRAADPLVVDLGYGASPVTALELHARLRAVRADVEVVGLEIDPARVDAARPLERPGVCFGLGGFEVGGPVAGRRPALVRAANVLRQYDASQVGGAWSTVTARLADGGLLVDATCDEVGRRAAWVAVTADGPASLTVSLRLAGLDAPSSVAERLPKALIHRNVPGERVHAWLAALDDAWRRHAPLASFGARQRWVATCRSVAAAGWPVLGGPSRWRLGEVGVAWDAVAPS